MLEGYLVMSAHQRVTGIPFVNSFSDQEEHSHQHLSGRYAGISTCRATAHSKLYLPQRSRTFVVLQDTDVDFTSRASALLAEAEGSELVGFENKLRSISLMIEKPPTRFASLLEAHGAGSYLAFFTRLRAIYFWGAANDSASILCWSTSPDFGKALHPDWWVVPLGSLTDDVKVVHVHRSVQRWRRWLRSGLDTSQCFLTLIQPLSLNASAHHAN